MPGDDRKQINFVVDADTKAEMEQYADEHPDFSSLSDLVRTSVIREMHDGYVLKSDVEAAGGGGGLSATAEETLSDIQDTLASLDDRIHNLEASSDKTPDEIKDLAVSLVDVLPKLAEQGTPRTAYVSSGMAFNLEETKFDTQLEALTDYANRHHGEWSEHDTRRALEYATHGMARVKKTRVGTNARWYVVDPDNPTPAEARTEK